MSVNQKSKINQDLNLSKKSYSEIDKTLLENHNQKDKLNSSILSHQNNIPLYKNNSFNKMNLD